VNTLNILLILVDQWPAWAFSHLGSGVRTPNIDRLAEGGTVFTNAFTVCPLCTPARGALLTARWPQHNGVVDNVGGGYALQPPLRDDEVTWIDEGVRRGFHMGYFGKWHLGPDGPIHRGAHAHSPHFEPNARVYDPATSDYSYENCKRREEERAAKILVRGRPFFWGELRHGKEQTPAFRIMRKGVEFLQERARGGIEKPFFLTVSSNPPHFPHYLPPEYAALADGLEVELPANIGDDFGGKPWWHGRPWWPCMDTAGFSEEEWRRIVAYSWAHIMLVDEAVGQVLDALDRLKLAERTVVVFVGDHGDMQGAHNRFDKGAYFYEEVWRIPLVVRHPDFSPVVQESFVSILDVGRTLFSLLGARDGAGAERSGRDIAPLLGRSSPAPGWPQVAYGVYELYNGMSFAIRAVRDRRFKYVWNPQDVDELYDLETDPHELRNLAGDPSLAGEQARLRGILFDWMRTIGDDLPERAPSLPPAGTIVATGKPGP